MFLAAHASEGASLTLAWDPSPDPAVAGYRVYVGTTSGSYSAAFDAGGTLSFVFANAVSSTTYYFAVAAYTSAGLTGPMSTEVVGMASAPTPAPAPAPTPTPGHHTAPHSTAAARSDTPVCASSDECYIGRTIAERLGRPTSLAVATDGRLFFIEDGQRIRVVAEDTLVPEPALAADAGISELTSLALDPRWPSATLVYVAQREQRRDGGSEASVVRYRELQNVLGEGATVIPGVPVASIGDVPLAIDAARRLYLATPASILRFNSDGTVPEGQRAGSPLFAAGYSSPTALVVEPEGNGIWLSGTASDGAARIAELAADSDDSRWPRLPSPVELGAAQLSTVSALTALRRSASRHDTATLLVLSSRPDGTNVLVRLTVRGDRTVDSRAISLPALGEPVAVASSRSGDTLYVAVRETDSDVESFSIVKLRSLSLTASPAAAR